MSNAKKDSKQQKHQRSEKQNGAKTFATRLAWTKEQYKAYTADKYRRCKEWLNGPWWLQEKEPVAKFTGWVALYTFTLAVVACLQTCVLTNQVEEMRTEQRPWLSFT